MSRLLSLLVAVGTAAALAAPTSAQTSLPGDPIPEGTPIQTTASGLQYAVLRAGEPDGKQPQSILDTFTAHYTGWLKRDGMKFDSSLDRGSPLVLGVGQVIPGWTEGLQLMTVGSKYKFIIPSDIGYGERGSPPSIPANADLVFDVELLDVAITPVPTFVLPNDKLANCDVEENGLLVHREKTGEGELIGAMDKVSMHYTMWLTDGTLVDSSLSSERVPLIDMRTLGLEGMVQALRTMRAGGVANVLIPSKLAFGPRPSGRIPPNSDIVCRLDVRSITAGPKPVPKPDFQLPQDDMLTTTASGLKYMVIEPGEGASPAATDVVTVHYAGWLTDGTPFDDSYSRGETSSFPLNRVIKGWTEGLQLMKPGAEYVFVIPGDLAYGERGSPPRIPPNATLVFHVELVRLGN